VTNTNHRGALRARRLRLLALPTLAVIAAALAGCGSSSSSSSSAAVSSASSTAAASTPAASGTSAAAAAAQTAVASYLKPPASIGTDVPLKSKPPTGVKIVAMSCQLSVCETFRNQVASVGKTLGWTTTSMSFTGTPESTLQTVESAIALKPTAIIINGEPRATYEAALPQAIANHVSIVTQMGELSGAVKPPFIAVQYQAPEFGTMSKATGQYVIASSDGKADALVVKYADFPLSVYIADQMAKSITSNCSTCKAQELLVQASDTGEQLANAVVSKLRADPSLNYVVFQDGAMALGIDAALANAGLLGKVKVASNDVTPQVIQSIISGKETAVMAFSLEAAAYNGIDAVARHLEGMPAQNVPLMNQIFTKSNLGGSPQPSVWNALPADIGAQYAKLWHVS
jgi:ribose transport system substrate-binding protein